MYEMLFRWMKCNYIEFAFKAASWPRPDQDVAEYKVAFVFVPFRDELLKMI